MNREKRPSGGISPLPKGDKKKAERYALPVMLLFQELVRKQRRYDFRVVIIFNKRLHRLEC